MQPDLQYQVLTAIQSFIVTNVALPLDWDDQLSATQSQPNAQPMTTANVLIVDKARSIPELRMHTYMQIYDLSGATGYALGGGNIDLTWEIGVSIRKGFMIDRPYTYTYANKQMRHASWMVMKNLNLQYIVSPTLIPEPLHLKTISKVKQTFGKSSAIELEIIHSYRHRLFSPWEAVQ